MAAPDFYFAVNALFRYLHDRYGHRALIGYWRNLGCEYYSSSRKDVETLNAVFSRERGQETYTQKGQMD